MQIYFMNNIKILSIHMTKFFFLALNNFHETWLVFRYYQDVAGGLTLSSDKRLDFYAITLSLLEKKYFLLKYHRLVEILNNFVLHHL